MNALVTAIGSFSAGIVIKRLKKEHYNVIGCDIYPKEWLVESKLVDRFYRAPLAAKMLEYVNYLIDICKKEKIDFILPLTDIEIDVLNTNREIFECCNVRICMSSEASILLCRNKYLLTEFLKGEKGIKTIPTMKLDKDKPLPYDLPVVCKPKNGRSSQGLLMIKSGEEWRYYKKNYELTGYIVQPHIDGNVITVDAVRQPSSKQTVVLARKELRRTSNGAGLAVYVYNDESLTETVKRLADYLGICGCVNFEFLLDREGNYYLLECNPRFSGGVEFSVLAGYDFVSNHMKCFKGEDITPIRTVKNQYLCKKYETYVLKTDPEREAVKQYV